MTFRERMAVLRAWRKAFGDISLAEAERIGT